MNTLKVHEPMQGITGKYAIKRYRKGAVDKAQPFFAKAYTLIKREAWVRHAIDHLGVNWLAPYAKRLQRKTRRLIEQGEQILESNFLGVAVQGSNLVVSSNNHGRNLVCQRLAGTNTYSLNIGHVEMGTSSTTPTNADTDLNAAVVRGSLTLGSVSGNVVTLRFFLSDASVADGTYREMGTFIDGTATLGTGQMWNHALFASAYVKATGEDTTIELVITVN